MTAETIFGQIWGTFPLKTSITWPFFDLDTSVLPFWNPQTMAHEMPYQPWGKNHVFVHTEPKRAKSVQFTYGKIYQ